ncbi:competence type IV pilus minor pilin ComGD [Alteribacter natronophilus]|uniref:competence type IV pilus minor pilin ComGD n=1 Tax=Alteribacter natronophilus TaxID=2583810 RepID=UPI00110D9583|nr:competence type IV pilus minor pilin ComGD [Alteribacter natronophilus]TMW73780.1 prepilin-type N-terminal cleavage/methylation domain-containing protein [Alteribacter natronophilus]
MRNDEKGYTLTEMLIVLAVLSVLVLIAAPAYKLPEKSEEAAFISVFESDLYEAQIRALADGKPVHFLFDNSSSRYTIRQDLEVVNVRSFPEGLVFQERTLGPRDLRYTANGDIYKAGSFIFRSEDGSGYRFVFPFLRGRFYHERL